MSTSILASCSNIILTHNLDDPEPVNKITSHDGIVNEIMFNHNNQVLASCGNDGLIHLSHS